MVSQGRFAEALTRFSNAASLEPNSPEYHFKAACAAWDAWEHTLVAPCFQRAIALAPKHPQSRKLLALWYQFQGHTAGFLEQSEAALAIRPGDPDLVMLRVYALVAGGQADAGLKLLEPLLGGNPVTEAIARCYAAVAEKLHLEAQAVGMIDRALRLPGAHPEATVFTALCRVILAGPDRPI